MKNLILVFLALQGTTTLAATVEEIAKYEVACKIEGLACAKLGYHYNKLGDAVMALKYYQQGCDLQDQTSCYNLENVKPEDLYYVKVHARFNFAGENILDCHMPNTAGYFSKQDLVDGMKQSWHQVNFETHINSQGRASLVKIDTKLPVRFQECAHKVINNLSFPIPPAGFKPIFRYQLTIKQPESLANEI